MDTNARKKTFVWLTPILADGKRRPMGSGVDILRGLYGDDFTLTGGVLPDVTQASGLSADEGAKLLKDAMVLDDQTGTHADYLIVEGAPVRVLLALVEDGEYEDRVLAPTRGDMGIVEEFQILLPRLATKRFPPD